MDSNWITANESFAYKFPGKDLGDDYQEDSLSDAWPVVCYRAALKNHNKNDMQCTRRESWNRYTSKRQHSAYTKQQASSMVCSWSCLTKISLLQEKSMVGRQSSTKRLRNCFSCIDEPWALTASIGQKSTLRRLFLPLRLHSFSYCPYFIHSFSYCPCSSHCSYRVALFLPDLIDSSFLDPVSLWSFSSLLFFQRLSLSCNYSYKSRFLLARPYYLIIRMFLRLWPSNL
jgi:hypothetical protein